jgi:hypothetical protein
MANARPKPYATSQSLDDFLGKPALIKGEDEAQYRRLLDAITHEMQPQTLLEKIRVRELVDKIWDQRRHKEGRTAVVDIAFIGALAGLLRQHMPCLKVEPLTPEALLAEDTAYARALAQAKEYFDGNTAAKRRSEIAMVLKQYGISQEQIRARAMESCSVSIQLFKRMEDNDDKFIRRALKDHDRRLAEQARQEQSIEPDEETGD